MVSQLQKLPADESFGTLESVAHFDGAMPTSVTVSHQGRIFVNFPKWGDEVAFTVAEIRDGGHRRYDVAKLLGTAEREGKTVCYARVSTRPQKEDLQRQSLGYKVPGRMSY